MHKPHGLTFRELAVTLLVGIGGAVFVLPVLGLGDAVPGLIAITILSVGALAIYRLVNRQRQFMLLIETAGAQTTALASKGDSAEHEILQIKSAVVDAIENPPNQERLLQVSGDIVMGDKVGRDKYQQAGSGNSFVSN